MYADFMCKMDTKWKKMSILIYLCDTHYNLCIDDDGS